MQLFILIRGHQGSGKSTFAQQKIESFMKQYPNAIIVHLENDLLLTDEHGVYRWSGEAVDNAQRVNLTRFKEVLKSGQQNPAQDILIVNSNTNQKSSSCYQLLQLAQKFGFDTQVYRLHNFFDNVHNVKKADVLSAYIKLNNNKIAHEIHVPAIKPIDDETKALVEEMKKFNLGCHQRDKHLSFDEKQQTYVTQEYLSFGAGNFIKKQSRTYPQLFVLKYARKVFYTNSFDNALLEMRGMILDAHNQIIVRPFKKTFNYSERIAKNSRYPIVISEDTLVNAVVKVNGFLGVCTYVSLDETHPSFMADFNGQVLYSTTGSLDSDFAKMNKEHCQKYEHVFKEFANHSFLFEITDPKDIHIIKEEFGETLIGVVNVKTGKMMNEEQLDALGKKYHIKRPARINNIRFGDLKVLLKTVQHEGFMVFDDTHTVLFKLKSPYYLISKFLGRSHEKNLDKKLTLNTLNKRDFDEEYYPLIEHIKANKDEFNALSELDKIAFIQKFLQTI